MGTRITLVVALGVLAAACSNEAPAESEPGTTATAPPVDDLPPPSAMAPGISDAIIPGDPAWPVVSWTRLPVTTPAPTLESLLGTVAVILCFQHW